ncbi:ClpP/crotonase-like domain-containing protein [Apiospora phragmitis]|uniref:ClpP/crotonase-like domain-containing protein n=1 Tax=Apiospora phragmitis TaxID=2905665 RepID=A0ABR1W705_9PEZI
MQLISRITTDDIKVSANNQGVARNAFSQAMIDTIVVALRELDTMPEVRAVVIAGLPEGPFCAGMDIKELVAITTAAAHRRSFLKDLTDAFAGFSKPTIAAVVGAALGGGCGISLACDMIYAAEDAMFGLPEMKIGTIPGAGGTQRLARALGKHKAMEFILTGEPASGAEFERLGMVTRTFPQGASSGRGSEARHQNRGPVRPAESSTLEMGMVHEKALYYSTFDVYDCHEGQRAFLEKRMPNFEHR